MAFSVTKMREAIIDTHVEFADQRLEFSFSPDRLQESWYKRQAAAMRNEDYNELLETMNDALISWDMKDDDENDVPVGTPEAVEAIRALELPLPLIGMINNKVQVASQDGGNSIKKKSRGR